MKKNEEERIKIVVKQNGKCFTCALNGLCYRGRFFRAVKYIVGIPKHGNDGMAVVHNVGGLAVTNIQNQDVTDEPVLLKVNKIIIMNHRPQCSLVYKTQVVTKGDEQIKQALKPVYTVEHVLFQLTMPRLTKRRILQAVRPESEKKSAYS